MSVAIVLDFMNKVFGAMTIKKLEKIQVEDFKPTCRQNQPEPELASRVSVNNA